MVVLTLAQPHRPIGYIHLPETLIRFARTHRDWLRSTNQLVEFYKSCLNQIQYGMIDAEILQHCMQIVKGEDDWNSTGKTNVGLGLIGPLPLDESDHSQDGEKEAQEGSDEGMQSDNEADNEKDVKLEEDQTVNNILQATSHWGCPCLRPYKRTEVLYCDGKVRYQCIPQFARQRLTGGAVWKQVVALIMHRPPITTGNMEMPIMLLMRLCFFFFAVE